MASSVLLSSLLMGVVLLGIVAGVLRLRRWERGAPEIGGADALDTAVRSPAVWTAAFVVLALGFGLGAVAIIGGSVPLVPEDAGFWSTLTAFLVPFLLLMGGYVFLGVYSSARENGLSSAPAVGLGSVAVGFLLLVAIVLKLFLGA